MAFDGEFIKESVVSACPLDAAIKKAWEYAEDIGSKWFYYPFYFLTTESGKTVIDAPKPLEFFMGRRVKSVAKIFAIHSEMPGMKGVGVEEFAYSL